MDLALLHNEATQALASAKAIAEDPEKGQAEFEAAMADYREKLSTYDSLKKVQDEADRLAADKPIVGKDIDIRDKAIDDPLRVEPVSAAVANRDPSKFVALGNGNIVPVANERTEGYVRSLPKAVQRPEIMAMYSPEWQLEAQQQRDAFALYMRGGLKAVAKRDGMMEVLNAMQEGTDSEGGYLVPTDQRTEIIHDPGAPAGSFRRLSRVLTTIRDSGTVPTGTTITWGAIAEEATPADTDPVFGQISFTIRKSGANMKLSDEFLADEASDVIGFLNQTVRETSGRYEDQQGIEGDGTTEPLGLRTAAAHGTVADITDLITVAGSPSLTEITAAYFEVPAQFRGPGLAWHMTSGLFAKITAISPAGGQVWTLPQGSDRPIPRLLGAPVEMFDGTGWDSAAAIAANEELGCIGDFNQYWFVDRMGTTVSRDDSVYSASDQVLVKARKRYDSFFAIANAFRIIKAATS